MNKNPKPVISGADLSKIDEVLATIRDLIPGAVVGYAKSLGQANDDDVLTTTLFDLLVLDYQGRLLAKMGFDGGPAVAAPDPGGES